MQLGPTRDSEKLKTLLNSFSRPEQNMLRVFKQDVLEQSVMEQLASNCLFGEGSVRSASQEAVWQISQFMGMPYATPEALIRGITRDGIEDVTVPVIDAKWLPFELAEIIIEAGKEMEAGPIFFLIDLSDANARGYVCSVLCAAIRKSWQAPVVFIERCEDLGISWFSLDWRNMFNFDAGRIAARFLGSKTDSLMENGESGQLMATDLKALWQMPRAAWEDTEKEMFDYCCNLFEELEIAETFPLIKRYLIPERSNLNIEEIL